MKMKKMILAAIVLVALAACKSNVKERAKVTDLPRAETPDRELNLVWERILPVL